MVLNFAQKLEVLVVISFIKIKNIALIFLEKLGMLELEKQKEPLVYKYLKFKFLMKKVKKLQKIKLPRLHHNGAQANQQVKL